MLITIVLLLPLAYASVRGGFLSRDDFLFNAGQTGFLQTLGSIICGNIGIGTFLALFLFAAESPVLGYAIAGAYTLGLVFCGGMSGVIHRAARATKSYGLVDYLIAAHGITQPLLIWIPISAVFLMRIVVQLLALMMIVASTFELGFVEALGLSVAVVGGYTSIGGYKVATETDLPQAIIILLGVFALFVGITQAPTVPEVSTVFYFGSFSPALLVGIVLFLPFSAVLAVDNWQRIATSEQPTTAQAAFWVAAGICGTVYGVITYAGQIAGEGVLNTLDTLEALRGLMPANQGWIAELLLVVAVVSSIDTFVMPLMTALARTQASLPQVRLMVLAMFGIVSLVTLGLGEIVLTIIAAFNTLGVFLPATFGALWFNHTNGRAAVLSINFGVFSTLIMSALWLEAAALLGFGISVLTYILTISRDP